MQGFFIPLEKILHAILNLDFMCPAEGVELRNINEFSHSTIGLGNIELYCALETNGFYHQF